MMTKKEIEMKIADAEERLFFIMMTDHYTRNDWELLNKTEKELKELNELKAKMN